MHRGVRSWKLRQADIEDLRVPPECALWIAVIERAVMDWINLPKRYADYEHRCKLYEAILQRKTSYHPRKPRSPESEHDELVEFFFEPAQPHNLEWITRHVLDDGGYLAGRVREALKQFPPSAKIRKFHTWRTRTQKIKM